MGSLVGAVLHYCYVHYRTIQKQSCSLPQSSGYEDVTLTQGHQTMPSDILLKQNTAYGPSGTSKGEVDLQENVAYGKL